MLYAAYEEDTRHLPIWFLRIVHYFLDDWRFSPRFRSWKFPKIGHYEHGEMFKAEDGYWYRISTWISKPWPEMMSANDILCTPPFFSRPWTKTQKEMLDEWGPTITANGHVYKKKTKVFARPSIVGEVIQTITSDGLETTNTGSANKMLIENQTIAKEQYLIDNNKFYSRYELIGPVEGREGWSEFKAIGKCMAIVWDQEDGEFIASWVERMVIKKGDMLCMPVGDNPDIYRIAKQEFFETYE